MSTYKKKMESSVAITITMLIVSTVTISLGTMCSVTQLISKYGKDTAPEVSDQGKGAFVLNSSIT